MKRKKIFIILHSVRVALRYTDKFLSSWLHWWVAVSVVTVFYRVMWPRTVLFLPFVFSMMTVWVYMSCRKYGWLDTVIFLAVWPFMLMAAFISFLDSFQPVHHEIVYAPFAVDAAEAVKNALNEVYDGKVLDTHMIDGRVYIKVELPFGIHPPENELVAGIAHGLHISPTHILYDPIADGRNYYVFGEDAVREYQEGKYASSPAVTFAALWDRLLCKSRVRISRQSPRG